jgi:hypothetical protein
MKKQPLVEGVASLPRWPFNLGALASAPFLLEDFSSWAQAYPGWAGPFGVLQPTLILAFAICVVFLIAVHVARAMTVDSYKDLKERAKRAQELEDVIAENITEIINGIILGLVSKLGLKQDDNSRISLYVNHPSGDLVNVGRVATNPNIEKVGRKILPKNVGCVGKAWAEGWAYVRSFGEGEYVEHECHYGMKPEEIQGLAMKPQFMAALRIDDGPREIAVVVFESLQPERFDETRIRRELSSFCEYVTGTLVTLTPHLPQPLSGGREDL